MALSARSTRRQGVISAGAVLSFAACPDEVSCASPLSAAASRQNPRTLAVKMVSDIPVNQPPLMASPALFAHKVRMTSHRTVVKIEKAPIHIACPVRMEPRESKRASPRRTNIFVSLPSMGVQNKQRHQRWLYSKVLNIFDLRR
jgi:hypothetical protein